MSRYAAERRPSAPVSGTLVVLSIALGFIELGALLQLDWEEVLHLADVRQIAVQRLT
jgi:hypothetical protein